MEVPRYSTEEALNNPLRGYPAPIDLYGMGTDPTLLSDPAFNQCHDTGLDPDGAFVRNSNDPVTRSLDVARAERVPHGDIYM